ncbi:hypothetical protein [Streptomyces mirabilis]|uniref:hypothetical protein n=1 Tax=Streptomyces mirabilis TaxID=68239 RepID=UPI0036AEF34C
MARYRYRDLSVPDDSGRSLREEIARLIYGFDAVADADRPRRDYLQVADNILKDLARRAVGPDGGRQSPGGVNRPPAAAKWTGHGSWQ